MPYTIVDNFSAGLDTRRHVLNSKPGTLAKIINAHITRGGEIEKRKKFEPYDTVVNNFGARFSVYGLEATSDGLYAFTTYEGVTTQNGKLKIQLLKLPEVPPSLGMYVFLDALLVGSFPDIEQIKDKQSPVISTVFGGKIFAIHKWVAPQVSEDPSGPSSLMTFCLAFYDGKPIKDWYRGITEIGASDLSISTWMQSFFSESETPGYSAELIQLEPEDSPTGFIQPWGFIVTGKPAVPYTVTHVEAIKRYFDVSIDEVQKSSEFVESVPAKCQKILVGGSEINSTVFKASRYLVAQNLPGIRSLRVGASSATADDGLDLIGWTSLNGLKYNTYPASGVGSPTGELWWTLRKAINDNTTSGLSHGYKAEMASYGGWSGWDPADLWIKAPSDFGELPNGDLLQIEFDSDPRLANVGNLGDLIDVSSVAASPYNSGKFIATMGVFGGGSKNQVTSIKVDGVEVLGAPVAWEQSHSYTMNKIKTQLENYVSPTEYDVEVSGPSITFKGKPGTGKLHNDMSLVFTTNGNMIFTGANSFQGGIDAKPALPQRTRVVYRKKNNNLFVPAGVKYGITITPSDNPTNPVVVGATRMADTFGKDPSFVFTYKSKVYVGFGSVVYFSALNDCTKWGVYDLGSGFIDMSNNFGGREDLTGCGVYQDKMVFFTQRSLQTWYMDPDPSLNRQIQVIENTGCIASESIISIGSTDLIYLSENGIRSVRARESTDSAYTNDIGSAIDETVIMDMHRLDNSPNHNDDLVPWSISNSKNTTKSAIDPIDGRLVIIMGDVTYVLSMFAGAGITAWSTYEAPEIKHASSMVQYKDRLYVGTNYISTGPHFDYHVFCYGGADGQVYDNCPVEVEMPYLDAAKPATIKEAKGVDITCEGVWKIELGFDHTIPAARDHIATVSESTMAHGRVMATGFGTHFGPRFTSSAQGKAKIANFIVHFDERNSKHEAG